MTAWEYLEVEFVKIEKKGMGLSIAASPGYRPRYVNGEQLPDWEQNPHFLQYLQELGEENWELAGNGPAHHGGFVCIFKRPKH